MITIIAAVAKNRAIGNKNKLIYWLPNDLKRFKALTTGHTIIMGRNTFLSLPKGALPNRRNIVLSRSAFKSTLTEDTHTACPPPTGGDKGGHPMFPGCEVYPSLNKALQHCRKDEDIYIIGGASVYSQSLPLADRLCLTEIDDVPAEADTFFPPINPEEFHEVSASEIFTDEKSGLRYQYLEYQKIV